MSYTLDKTMGEIWEAACAGRVIVLKYFESQEAFELDEPTGISQQTSIIKDLDTYCLNDTGFGSSAAFSGTANVYGQEQQK